MTDTTSARSSADELQRGVERILLLAGGDLAAYAAARWVARRAGQHPVEVALVGSEDERVDPGRVERTAEVVRRSAPAAAIRDVEPSGDGRDAVVRAAQEADLAVLGTNRVTALARMLPPTASVRIAEAVGCPVVLVPSGWQPRTAPVVLGVALDGSDAAAIRFASAEAHGLQRDLVLLHVWHLSDVVTPVFAFALDESPIRAEHATRLATLQDRIRHENPSLTVTTELVHGEARKVLPARGQQAELVVVGSHSRSSAEKMLLGSVGRALAERPACPVAIVPPGYGHRPTRGGHR